MQIDDFLQLLRDAAEANPGGCWEWSRARTAGYGQVFLSGGEYHLAHRLAFALTVRPLAVGEVVCHCCDNPACFRPDHLFAGTQADNVQDMMLKGRQRLPPTHCQGGHPLSGDNLAIRKCKGYEVRTCRICERSRMRAKYRRRVERRKSLAGASAP